MLEQEHDKENNGRTSVSLAKKLAKTVERVLGLLAKKQFSGQVEESVENNVQSCLDLMSSTEKLLIISSDDKLPHSPAAQSKLRKQTAQPSPLGKVDTNSKVPMKREDSELDNALLFNFMQSDAAKTLGQASAASLRGEDEQKEQLPTLEDDDDIEFLQQAQDFENSLLAGGSSPVAEPASSGSSSDEAVTVKVEAPDDIDEDDDDDQNSEENQKYLKVLKHYFGFSKFRGLQLKVIKTLIEEKRDQLVVMATGQGKSLCYQFPALFLKGMAVVISPLISLMEDQVMALKLVNVEACLLGSAQDKPDEIKEKIFSGQCRILYITPEFIDTAKDLLESIQSRVGISLLAIDECHCVSQWGNDFRPSYRNVGARFREMLKGVPFLALTATATPDVRQDILESLQLRNPLVTVTSFDRPNLYLSVFSKSSSIRSDLAKIMVETTVQGTEGRANGVMTRKTYKFDGSTIIYCQTKTMTANIVEELRSVGIKCEQYHAGLPLPTRKKAQVQFTNDEIDVMVATVAFGMGIDKPDIRNIIHYGAPSNIESYYQEIGRAGRDGLPSRCFVFYAPADYGIIQFFLNEIKIPSHREHRSKMFALTKNFLTTTYCRRHFILNFFEDISVKNGTCRRDSYKPNCCDNCTQRLALKSSDGSSTSPSSGSTSQIKDMSSDARLLFRTIKHMGERFGMAMVVGYLIGSKAQKVAKITEYVSSANGLYGAGRSKSEAWWKAFAQQLTNENYLDSKMIQGGFGATVCLTPKARQFLADQTNSQPVMLFETGQLKDLSKPTYSVTVSSPHAKAAAKLQGNIILPLVPVRDLESLASPAPQTSSTATASSGGQPTEADDEMFKKAELYKVLISVRNEIAVDSGVNPHRICSNRILTAFAHIRPSVIANLRNVEGFPQANLSAGQRFIDKIVSFCHKYKLKTDNLEPLPSQGDLDSTMSVMQLPSNLKQTKMEQLLLSLSETKRKSYLAFQIESRPVDEIALARGLAPSTVTSHLEEALLIGLPVDFSRLGITIEAVNKFEARIRQPPINSNVSKLNVIKDQMPELPWDHLRIMIALLRIKYGASMDEDDLPADEGMVQQKLAVVRDQSSSASLPQVKDEPATGADSASAGKPSGKHLPEWIKRPLSDQDIKTAAERETASFNSQPPSSSSSSSSNPKKKPKLGI